MKFCKYIASLHLHILTDFCGFILIFNNMALIFLGVPIVFNVFSLSFIKSNRRNFIANNEWPPIIHPTSIHWIIRLGRNAGVLLQAAIEAKTVSKFTDALSLIWFALPKKAINNAAKDNRS